MLRGHLSRSQVLGGEGAIDPIFDQCCMATSSHLELMAQGEGVEEGEVEGEGEGGFVPWHFEQVGIVQDGITKEWFTLAHTLSFTLRISTSASSSPLAALIRSETSRPA